jgi:hypothetical protein
MESLHVPGLSVTSALIRAKIKGTSGVLVFLCVEKIPVVVRSPLQGILLGIHDSPYVKTLYLRVSKDVIGDMCMRLAERAARNGKINPLKTKRICFI